MTVYQKNNSGAASIPTDRLYFIASTVSSKFLRSLAAKEGMRFEDTLTGFKWMCSRTKEVEEKEEAGVGLTQLHWWQPLTSPSRYSVNWVAVASLGLTAHTCHAQVAVSV